MNARNPRTRSVPPAIFGALTLFFLSVLILGAPVARAAVPEQDAVDISGYYGEKDGEFFRVTRNGESYQVLWHQKGGDWIGVAIRDGANLAVGWHRSDGANLGVALYRIGKNDKGPTLTGGWAAYPGGAVVKDTPIWSRKLN
jgi:hypothetical protein